jgi:tetraacyldisaccharide 4'-kinase
MIPAGNYREPLRSLKRANVIVMNHKFGSDKNNKPKKIPALVETIYKFGGFRNINDEVTSGFKKALCFCGIGDPDSFLELLKLKNVECVKCIKFADHHNFAAEDIEKIKSEFKQSGADCILTTQKDFMRLKYSAPQDKKHEPAVDLLNNFPVYFALISMEVIKNELFITEKISDLLKD